MSEISRPQKEQPLLRARNITYTFVRTEALKGIDFDLFPGEIHAITGDHRSGKSTFAGILSGAISKQGGTIEIKGKEIYTLTPRIARRLKIGAVYQEPLLIQRMSVLENIYSGRMPKFYISSKDLKHLEEECRNLFKLFGVDINPYDPILSLSEGNQQIVELVRVMAQGTEIIILDEISRRLKPAELEHVFSILRSYKNSRKGFIYITSMIDEVVRIADRVTVLKDGYRRSTDYVTSVDRSRLINLAYSFAVSSTEQSMDRNKLLLLSRYNATLIKDLPVGILILDTSQGLVLANTAAEKALYGSKAIPSGMYFLDILRNRGMEKVEEVERALQARESQSWPKLRTSEGNLIKLKIFPLNEEDGIPAGSAVLVEDITIDYVTKEYLSRAEKIASTAELAAGVAHEINNPLGIVKNYVEYLKIIPRTKDETTVLEAMEKEIERMVDIVSSLLSFSRVQQNYQKEVDLRLLLDELIILLDHRIGSKRITISRAYASEGTKVLGYENRLKQLFLNLITNAIEAVLEDGKIELAIFPSERDQFVTVTITDNGCGIPQDTVEDVFKPFFTTKMTKTNTGLGLSICQHIAELHNGVITFESKLGQGTRFIVRLPTGK